MPSPKIIGDFIIEDEIGKGSFATVYKGFNRNTGLNVAIKVIHTDRLNNKLLQNLDLEISILKSCRHENIVRLLMAKKTENNIYLIMEYCSGGDFAKWLRRRKLIAESDARYYLRQLANGILFMHEQKLIHRDLKPQNLLLTERDKDYCRLKIADFGFAKHLNSAADLAATVCGSPLYMAPEVLMHERYNSKADLWSIGIILYEMIWGKPPFRAENHIELAKKFAQRPVLKFPSCIQIIEKSKHSGSSPQTTMVQVSVSKECRDLLASLLQLNPRERISVDEFFSHPFFNVKMTMRLPTVQHFSREHLLELIGMEQQDELSGSQHASREREVDDCKYAHFLLLVFEETENSMIICETARFLRSSIECYLKNGQISAEELPYASASKACSEEALKWIEVAFRWCIAFLASVPIDSRMEPANVHNLMMRKSIQIARNAAVEESLGYFRSALRLYEISSFLFYSVKLHSGTHSDEESVQLFDFSSEKNDSIDNEMIDRFESNLKLRILHLRNLHLRNQKQA